MSSEGRIEATINKYKEVFEKEGAVFVWSFLYFFSILTAYFILRPIRDAMGIAGGTGSLSYLFSYTFLAMLAVMPAYGILVSRYPRRKFLPYVYLFFIINILFFWFCFTNDIAMNLVAKIFFVWLSVFNVFVVSIFWSFMVDIYKSRDSKTLFGMIASGGTIGSITGPFIVTFLTDNLGTETLLLISASVLSFSIVCILKLVKLRHKNLTENEKSAENAIGGGMLDGLLEIFKSRYLMNITIMIILLSLTGTFAYYQQGELIYTNYANTDERVQIFGMIDLYVSIGALIFQVFVAGPVLSNYGIKGGIIILPIITVFGFILLAISPTIGVFIIFQTLRRASEYGMFVPSRENLFSVVSREEKYKAKNFIDTTVLRGGDVANSKLYEGLSTNSGLGLSLGEIAMVGVPIAAIWGIMGWKLGKSHEEQEKIQEQNNA